MNRRPTPHSSRARADLAVRAARPGHRRRVLPAARLPARRAPRAGGDGASGLVRGPDRPCWLLIPAYRLGFGRRRRRALLRALGPRRPPGVAARAWPPPSSAPCSPTLFAPGSRGVLGGRVQRRRRDSAARTGSTRCSRPNSRPRCDMRSTPAAPVAGCACALAASLLGLDGTAAMSVADSRRRHP